MKSLLILGRQPELGLAELESLYGAENMTVIGRGGALLNIDHEDVAFSRLGGSIKLAKVLTILEKTDWPSIEKYLVHTIPKHLEQQPEGKLRLGISTYGLSVSPDHLHTTSLKLKKVIKEMGKSVRFIPNKSAALNSAQVIHNKLTGLNGWELVLARFDDKTVLAQTIIEQDIEAYASRDQNRPMRDARVGMLPPKLAQILINLANPDNDATLLDPFCGTGVVLQEALLMGYRAYGSDLEPRMVEYSDKNLDWMFKIKLWNTEQGDATKHSWKHFDSVACETFLGKPLSSLPERYILDQIRQECDEIHEKFLKNIATQAKSGTRLCLAVPAWNTKYGFLHLKTLDLLDKLGYTRKSFVFASNEELIYHRPDQIVARELVILERK
ncbi:MAG: hypothetical protein M3Q36_03515 [bacterium]|nr:hypothetical protein [bacterium]